MDNKHRDVTSAGLATQGFGRASLFLKRRFVHLAPLFETFDSAFRRINIYTVAKY